MHPSAATQPRSQVHFVEGSAFLIETVVPASLFAQLPKRVVFVELLRGLFEGAASPNLKVCDCSTFLPLNFLLFVAKMTVEGYTNGVQKTLPSALPLVQKLNKDHDHVLKSFRVLIADLVQQFGGGHPGYVFWDCSKFLH